MKTIILTLLVIVVIAIIAGCAGENEYNVSATSSSTSTSTSEADAQSRSDLENRYVEKIPLECCPEDSLETNIALDFWETILPLVEDFIGQPATDLPTEYTSTATADSSVDLQLVFLTYDSAIDMLEEGEDPPSEIEEWFYDNLDRILTP